MDGARRKVRKVSLFRLSTRLHGKLWLHYAAHVDRPFLGLLIRHAEYVVERKGARTVYVGKYGIFPLAAALSDTINL
ncbi:hypothetical protein [Cohnella sp. WQ 127256]|uniref:hypothetical protein n=1 Tax=Cohnella sp. WQ 127256 TaxID=2938790 RepID=UPI0021197868|nr:hypothetical protein [Cohnella sp. WQ 127256]